MRIVFITLSIIIFSGCATAPNFKPVENIPENKALIYIYREPAFAGGAICEKFAVNYEYIANISSGKYFPYLADPGKVIIGKKFQATTASVLMGKMSGKYEEALQLNVEANNIYYVKCEVVFGGTKWSIVGNEIGSEEIKKCEMAEDER